MMGRDVLDEIADRKLSEDDARSLISDVLSSTAAASVASRLGFSRIEWTAFAQGAGLSEIASWRRCGWPSDCQVCGDPIEIENFGWFIFYKNGNSRLRHIRCPGKVSPNLTNADAE
jgi:hypothetical protein